MKSTTEKGECERCGRLLYSLPLRCPDCSIESLNHACKLEKHEYVLNASKLICKICGDEL